MTLKTISQRLKDIELFLEYAVPRADQARALELVKRHETDIIALNIFEAFYRFLPEAEDDFIKVLRLIARKEGTFLVCATTCLGNYLYLASTEKAVLIGVHGEGIPDPEVLDFFDFKDNVDFLKKSNPVEKFPVYVPASLQVDLCPICNAAHGECHTLGCPVEICPWCGGQLTRCECRFKELGLEHLFTESDFEAFAEKLNKKGRVPFDAEEHRPGYLGESKGPDSE
jgi:hypothetical protein